MKWLPIGFVSSLGDGIDFGNVTDDEWKDGRTAGSDIAKDGKREE